VRTQCACRKADSMRSERWTTSNRSTPPPSSRSLESSVNAATAAVRILGIDPGLRVPASACLTEWAQAALRDQRVVRTPAAGVAGAAQSHPGQSERSDRGACGRIRSRLEKVFVNVNPQSHAPPGPGPRRRDMRRRVVRAPRAEYTRLKVKERWWGKATAAHGAVQDWCGPAGAAPADQRRRGDRAGMCHLATRMAAWPCAAGDSGLPDAAWTPGGDDRPITGHSRKASPAVLVDRCRASPMKSACR